LKWDAALEAIQDRRKQGRIPTSVIVRAVLAMCLCRLGDVTASRRCVVVFRVVQDKSMPGFTWNDAVSRYEKLAQRHELSWAWAE
jgi:hypothetical protein